MSTTPNLSRRTIAKGAAWTLPVVAVAAAAPASAASAVCVKTGITTGLVDYFGSGKAVVGGFFTINIGPAKQQVSATFDGLCATVSAGGAIGIPTITLALPLSLGDSNTLTITGGSVAYSYNTTGSISGAGARTATLPIQAVPATTGSITLTAVGLGQAETAGAAGTAAITSGKAIISAAGTLNGNTFTLTLNAYANPTAEDATSTYPTLPGITIV